MAIAKLGWTLIAPAAAVLCALAAPGWAQDSGWKPTRHVEFLVGTEAGGAQDRVTRLVQKVVETQKLIPVTSGVVNKPGVAQGGAIAYMNTHRADPHYLVMLASDWHSSAIINNAVKERRDEVTPLLKLFDTKSNYSAAANSPFKGAQDIVAALKKDPGGVRFSSSAAPGSQNWITIIQFATAAGADPGKLRIAINASGAETMTQVLGGNSDIAVGGVDAAYPQVEAGKLRNVGILSVNRLSGGKAADWVTMREQGVDAVANNYYAMVGGKGITAEQVAYWEGVLKKVAESEDAKKFAVETFRSVEIVSAKDFSAFLDREETSQKAILSKLGLLKN